MEVLPAFNDRLWNSLSNERVRKGYEHLSQSAIEVLDQYGILTFEELLSLVHLNDKQLALILWRLLEEKKISKSPDGNGYQLPNSPQPTHNDQFGLNPRERKILSPTLHHWLEESWQRDRKLKEAFEKFVTLAEDRPGENSNYQQRHLTFRSSFLRALYMLARGDIANKRVVLIGDDDLTSLALQLLAPSVKLLVLEIDRDILHFLEMRGESLPGQCTYQIMDVSTSWNTSLNGSFSTVLCDPSKELYDLFLQRVGELLNPVRGVFYTCFDQTYSRDRTDQEFLSQIVARGFYITDVIPRFVNYHRYRSSLSSEFETIIPHPRPGKDSICFQESLVRAELMQEIPNTPTPLPS
ncbi:MAG: bis-aminopropyl spermidine synthase family protein [Prochloron sp. SP5CPC1]|nr:bis-aminopropyl spermidine synthase family protein [Candidatus Paraprochloron terpiosi SP5CPC1]